MDKHYSVHSITSETYLNRGSGTDIRITVNLTVMYAHKMQRHDKPNCHPNEPDQVLANIRQQLFNLNTHDPMSSNQNWKQTHRVTIVLIYLQELHEELRTVQGPHSPYLQPPHAKVQCNRNVHRCQCNRNGEQDIQDHCHESHWSVHHLPCHINHHLIWDDCWSSCYDMNVWFCVTKPIVAERKKKQQHLKQ